MKTWQKHQSNLPCLFQQNHLVYRFRNDNCLFPAQLCVVWIDCCFKWLSVKLVVLFLFVWNRKTNERFYYERFNCGEIVMFHFRITLCYVFRELIRDWMIFIFHWKIVTRDDCSSLERSGIHKFLCIAIHTENSFLCNAIHKYKNSLFCSLLLSFKLY